MKENVMTMKYRLLFAAALLPLSLTAPAAQAQFMIADDNGGNRGDAAISQAPQGPDEQNQPAADDAGQPAPAPAGLPANIGDQTLRDVAERVVGRKRAGQVAEIEAVARTVLGKDPAGAGTSDAVGALLPVVGELIKGVGKKKQP
jgi:hypothetical protein